MPKKAAAAAPTTGGHHLGYARVSTAGQDLTLQRDELAAAGCTRIFSEKASGARGDRPELARLLDHMREGDVVVVTRLDRLARSVADLLGIAERLRAAGVGLRSLAEPWADSTSPAGRLVLSILAGVADFERSLIVERTAAGREAAKKRGVHMGRPALLTPAQVRVARALIEEGKTTAAVARELGVHRATLYRAIDRGAE